jgi:hypothetical protein
MLQYVLLTVTQLVTTVWGVAIQHTQTKNFTGCKLYIQTSMAVCCLIKELSFIHLHLMLALATAFVKSSPRGHL